MSRINSGRKTTRSERETGLLRASNSIHLGFVKNTSDPQRMGRLQVWVPELGPDDPDTWITVSYAAPFAGTTSIDEARVDDKSEYGSQRSYGIWAVPPDVGNQVLICFVNGDAARGFWFGCVYAQNMNHMVPGIGMNVSTDEETNKAFAPYSPPVVEYNKKDSSVNPKQPSRPARSELADALIKQGLTHDPERGVTNTSARREDTSLVQGWLTPGGSSMSFDDDPDNSFIRFRTKSGAQIMISETSGFIYIMTKGGNSWMEISDGAIDLFSAAPISIRSEDDVNIRADGNLNFDAQGDLNLRAGGSIRARAGAKVELSAAGNLVTQAGGKASHSAGADIALSGVNVGVTATGSFVAQSTGPSVRNASVILDNAGGGKAVSTDAAHYKAASSIGHSDDLTTICSKVPTHEPYHHPVNAATENTSDGTGGFSSGSGGVIKRADGSTTKGVITPDDSPVRKISGFKISDRVNSCIYQASQRTGVPYAHLMAMAAQESAFNPNAGSSGSSAKGLFQFLGGTWAQTYHRYGPNGTVVRNPSVKNNVYDACSNALLGAYYYKENSTALSSAGLPGGPTEVYLTHLLGPSGGKKFLRAVLSNPNGANTVGNNPALFKVNGSPRTNKSAYNLIHSKIGATVPQWQKYQQSRSG